MNVIEFVPVRPTRFDVDPPLETTQKWGRFTEVGPVQWSADFLRRVLVAWAELTGQDQGWNMFTPEFPPYTVVMIAELHFPDGTTDRVASRFYPPARPGVRPPMVFDREFNYEANIFMLGWDTYPESREERADVWGNLPTKVRDNDDLIQRWLVWKAKQYAAAHPEKPKPAEVVLVLRFIPTPYPNVQVGGQERPVVDRPLARWLTAGPRGPGLSAVEAYDPLTGAWVRLKDWGRP
jgi:hypothetical protein